MPTNSTQVLSFFADLDGVFVDFFVVAERLLGAPYHSMPPAMAWGILDKHPHLFRGLPQLPGALELWAAVSSFCAARHIPLQVLTALPLPTAHLVTAPADKVHWVRANLDSKVPVHRAPSGPAKAQWAQPGYLLLDDTERNIVAWRAAGGMGILHTSIQDTMAQLSGL